MRRYTVHSVLVAILAGLGACQGQQIVLQGKVKLQGDIALGPVGPYISSLSQNYGPVNTQTPVIIYGTGFGASQGASTVGAAFVIGASQVQLVGPPLYVVYLPFPQ